MPDYKPLNVAVFDLNLTVYNKSSKEEFFRFICRKRKKKPSIFLAWAFINWAKNLAC